MAPVINCILVVPNSAVKPESAVNQGKKKPGQERTSGKTVINLQSQDSLLIPLAQKNLAKKLF
jgi:hypothetical protein